MRFSCEQLQRNLLEKLKQFKCSFNNLICCLAKDIKCLFFVYWIKFPSSWIFCKSHFECSVLVFQSRLHESSACFISVHLDSNFSHLHLETPPFFFFSFSLITKMGPFPSTPTTTASLDLQTATIYKPQTVYTLALQAQADTWQIKGLINSSHWTVYLKGWK